MWQTWAVARTILARRWYEPEYCPVVCFVSCLLAAHLALVCWAWSGQREPLVVTVPQVRQGSGSLAKGQCPIGDTITPLSECG